MSVLYIKTLKRANNTRPRMEGVGEWRRCQIALGMCTKKSPQPPTQPLSRSHGCKLPKWRQNLEIPLKNGVKSGKVSGPWNTSFFMALDFHQWRYIRTIIAQFGVILYHELISADLTVQCMCHTARTFIVHELSSQRNSVHGTWNDERLTLYMENRNQRSKERALSFTSRSLSCTAIFGLREGSLYATISRRLYSGLLALFLYLEGVRERTNFAR